MSSFHLKCQANHKSELPKVAQPMTAREKAYRAVQFEMIQAGEEGLRR